MSFEKDYTEIRKRAKTIVRLNTNSVSIDVDEVISSAYIKLIESNDPYTLEFFLKLAKREVDTIKDMYSGYHTSMDKGEGNKDKDRVCAECKQLLFIDLFYKFQKKSRGGAIRIDCYCKECRSKKNMVANSKRLMNPINKKKQSAYALAYYYKKKKGQLKRSPE